MKKFIQNLKKPTLFDCLLAAYYGTMASVGLVCLVMLIN